MDGRNFGHYKARSLFTKAPKNLKPTLLSLLDGDSVHSYPNVAIE